MPVLFRFKGSKGLTQQIYLGLREMITYFFLEFKEQICLEANVFVVSFTNIVDV